MLLWFLALLVLNTAVAFVLTRALQLADVEERVDSQFLQEVDELARLAGGNDPVTGEPFGTDTRRVFEVFLQRNLPTDNETYVALLDGRPALRSADDPPARLDTRPELVSTWADVAAPTDDRLTVDGAGEVRWLAVPVSGDPDGTFVVAWFMDAERRSTERAVRLAAATQLGAGAVLLLLLGRLLTRRLTQPIAAMTATTRSITTLDLSGRLSVDGDDELGDLAATINGLLSRLESALASQRRFVAEASHELRTPITVVQGHLDLLDDDPHERARTVAMLTDELDRMSRLVGDMLLLATAEQVDFVRAAPVRLDELAAGLARYVEPFADRQWFVRGDPLEVVVDGERVRQAVLALVDNAVAHTEVGDAIAVRLTHAGQGTHVRVTDTGSGIPAAEQAAVFDRFHRGADRSRPGAGLGLAIVRAIAEAHGGTAEVERTSAQGTVFLLVLPDPQVEQGG